MTTSSEFIAACYGLAVPLVTLVAAYALFTGYRLRAKVAGTDSFLTARGLVGPLRLGWSFFAGGVGAWVVASPANYASYAGLLGLCFYALASGLPFLMIAYAGDVIRRKVPHVLSLTHFIGWRFGAAAKLLVLLLVMFNMSVALLAEYLTIGSIFQSFVGSVSYAMIIVVGVLAMVYTAYGGLLVSIYTDQLQGIASLSLFAIVVIFVAATFRPPAGLPTPMPCGPETACITGAPICSQFTSYNDAGACGPGAATFFPVPCPTYGWSAIFVMPASLFTATVFSEAMWQKAWAAKDRRTLRTGAWLGAAAVVLVVFLAGFCGLLAQWAGLVSYGTYDADGAETSPPTDPNLYLFQTFFYGGAQPSSVDLWRTGSVAIGVLTVALAAVMNEGAVDSIQNGMAAGLTSYVAPLVRGWRLLYTRALVVLLNAVLVGIATWLTLKETSVAVLELFLLTNMLCCAAALPVLAGLFGALHSTFGGAGFVFSILFPIFATSVYGVNFYYTAYPEGFVDYTGRAYLAGSLDSALFFTWIGNGYIWQFFLLPLSISLGCIGLCVGVNLALNRFESKRFEVPGFTAHVTHPGAFPAGDEDGAEGEGAGAAEADGSDGSPKKGDDAAAAGAAAPNAAREVDRASSRRLDAAAAGALPAAATGRAAWLAPLLVSLVSLALAAIALACLATVGYASAPGAVDCPAPAPALAPAPAP